MTDTRCVVCGRPTADGYVCHADALSLAETLQDAAGHAEDAETVIARQARYGGGSRGGSDEPLPVDLTASTRLAAISDTITGWARHILEERDIDLPSWTPLAGPPCPAGWCRHDSCRTIRSGREPVSALALAAGWLATQTSWLRKRPEAKEAFRELDDACADLARLVDRPADKDLVGMCDCGKVLYANRGKTVVTCPVPTCKLTWDVGKSRDILRRSLDDKLVVLAEAARLAAYLDGDRTQDNIRKLLDKRVKAGRLTAHGEVDGEDTYRFGEIMVLLATIPKRERRHAPAAA